jgi:hypothetical protein
MTIKIKGSITSNEPINANLIEYLYTKFNINHDNCLLEGHVQLDYVYERWIDYLENLYNKFKCNINRELLVWFDDEEVKRVLVNNLSLENIGGVPSSKKVDLSSINTWFNQNTIIKTFNELGLFKNVVNLANNAFKGCTELEEIDLSCIEVVGTDCFYGDVKLHSEINMPNLTSLKNNAFRDCTSLTIVSDLGNITSTGTYIFYNCTSLTSIVIPETLTTLNNSFLNGCTSLTSIDLPETVTVLNDSALRNTAITEIDFSNFTQIGSSSFRDCKQLISDIDAPNLITLGSRAFQDCTSIKKVLNLGNITAFTTSTEGGFKRGVFDGCTSLEEVTLPNTLTIMTGYTFASCSNLKTVTGNPIVAEIGMRTFERCTSLETIPNSLLSSYTTSIETRAFVGCVKLNVTELNLPNLMTLGGGAFGYCEKLERITNLGSVTALAYYHNDYGTYGRNGEFEGCINLTDVNLPNTITKFDQNTFNMCSKLKNINIPTSLNEIGERCFGNCISLGNSILYFKNVTTIANKIFASAIINQIYFPSLTSIPGGWWSNWSSNGGCFSTEYNASQRFQCNLLYLKLAPDVPLNNGSFAYANIVNLIINNDTPPTIYQYTIPDEGTRCNITNIYVPAASVNTYKEAQYWSVLADKIKSIDDYPYKVNTYAEYEILRDNGDNNVYLIQEYMS